MKEYVLSHLTFLLYYIEYFKKQQSVLKPKLPTLTVSKSACVTAPCLFLAVHWMFLESPVSLLVSGTLSILSPLFENIGTFELEQLCLELFTFLLNVSYQRFCCLEPYGPCRTRLFEIKSSKPCRLWKLSFCDAPGRCLSCCNFPGGQFCITHQKPQKCALSLSQAFLPLGI